MAIVPQHLTIVQRLRALVQKVAAMKLCEEERDKCYSDSGPYCAEHGDSYLHEELITEARALLKDFPDGDLR